MKINLLHSEYLLRNSKPTTSDRGNAQKCFDSSQFQTSTDDERSSAVSKIIILFFFSNVCGREKKRKIPLSSLSLSDNAAYSYSTAAYKSCLKYIQNFCSKIVRDIMRSIPK